MQKTVFRAYIAMVNPCKKHFYDYFDRRVYVGEDGHGYVKLFGEYRPLSDYYRTSEHCIRGNCNHVLVVVD